MARKRYKLEEIVSLLRQARPDARVNSPSHDGLRRSVIGVPIAWVGPFLTRNRTAAPA